MQVKKLLRSGTGEVDTELVRTQWPEQLELETKYTSKALADEVCTRFPMLCSASCAAAMSW